MKKSLFASCLIGILAIAPATRAENLNDVSLLLSTRKCQNCDLSSTGLVNAKLGRADLRGSDLRQANLSRSDLSMADLRGADLTGASLVGANLAGANLEGAILDGADLREAYMSGANFTKTSLKTYFITRAVGLLNAPVSAEQLYQWGYVEGESNNYNMAIAYYNQAAKLDPSNGAIYLSRAIARYHIKDFLYAAQDAKFAQSIFKTSGSAVGIDISTKLIEAIDAASKPDNNSQQNNFGSVLATISSVLLKLFLP